MRLKFVPVGIEVAVDQGGKRFFLLRSECLLTEEEFKEWFEKSGSEGLFVEV